MSANKNSEFHQGVAWGVMYSEVAQYLEDRGIQPDEPIPRVLGAALAVLASTPPDHVDHKLVIDAWEGRADGEA